MLPVEFRSVVSASVPSPIMSAGGTVAATPTSSISRA
jgi:hypothetical protein